MRQGFVVPSLELYKGFLFILAPVAHPALRLRTSVPVLLGSFRSWERQRCYRPAPCPKPELRSKTLCLCPLANRESPSCLKPWRTVALGTVQGKWSRNRLRCLNCQKGAPSTLPNFLSERPNRDLRWHAPGVAWLACLAPNALVGCRRDSPGRHHENLPGTGAPGSARRRGAVSG